MRTMYRRVGLLLFLVAAISAFVLYWTVDANTLQSLGQFRPASLLLVAALSVGGLYFDAARLVRLTAIAGGRTVTMREAYQVVFGNYFLAMLTPGAAGGAFAQVLFLRRAGVPTGKATILVLVRTLLSILVLFLFAPLVFLFDGDVLPGLSQGVLLAGSLALLLSMLAMPVFFRTSLPDMLVLLLVRRLRRARRRRLVNLYKDVRNAVQLLGAAPGQMLLVLLQSAASLFLLYALVPALLWGLGGSGDFLTIMGRMVLLNILLYVAPTPGGAGIAEGGFVLLLQSLAAPGTVGVAALVWRVAAEYIPFGLGAIAVVQTFGRDFMRKIQSA
ncbi:MAG: lysylphosphatidylglycerol synthase transmembrane domain-containing protein [Anaeromusa sp.]|uniref:lysylphosphatidylglycerol synthase transmembrane domain-containing protein n=1 Tax=Anaeromusa sp. TaxID=1872520 RepID=UPI0026098100|nr:lysylphosphatidylglycerol synthase transmembrane domain-containing protein [Anaeromusa sp.]MDD3157053.1 lysylphosphatidylglycerol synthase transmembrane domain-containing protein [Anaeromusa sp.]MEA4834408.1 lysylphosphatidylglycerol synthase transmembrane domain-containing protein [Anaeromusa sp.]